MLLSNAEMELSKAETSVGEIEARLAKITIALLFVPIVCCLSFRQFCLHVLPGPDVRLAEADGEWPRRSFAYSCAFP
jgi:hypothetical protein